MPPKSTLWKLDPHTKAKHVILEGYLGAWFPILSRASDRIVYIDGFAGPGRYSEGEEGSPVIALRVAKDHFDDLAEELTFILIEQDSARVESLQAEIDLLKLPKHYAVFPVCSTFAEEIGNLLDDLHKSGKHLAPTFAFIDPFGVKDTPFELVARLLGQPRCEVLVTVMTGTINRFVNQLPDHVAALIGQDDAPKLIAGAKDRVETARNLYEKSLRGAAKFVRRFSMSNDKGVVIYDLFFASNHPLGHQKMKEAMWKADESGEYHFSDATDPHQVVLFRNDPAPTLADDLARRFAGKRADADVVRDYVRDHSPFIDKHATAALRLLEADERITIDEEKRDGTRRRRGTFPSGAVVHFPRR